MKQQLKIFSLADIEDFEVVNGKKIFPTGDYTAIKEFDGNSIFGPYSQFGPDTIFHHATTFGKQCKFGKQCSFGNHTEFGSGCSIGDKSVLKEGCHIGQVCFIGEGVQIGQYTEIAKGCFIGDYCTFACGCVITDVTNKLGNFCDFGDRCKFPEKMRFSCGTTFGEACSFGAGSEFADGCICEKGYEFIDLFTVGGVGRKNETIYFWRLSDGRILVRCGELVGPLSEFVVAVRKYRWSDNSAKDYVLAINYAISKLTFSCNQYDSIWTN